jgi:ADP-ribose pyrophosphatase YjhB (NUDIX family)
MKLCHLKTHGANAPTALTKVQTLAARTRLTCHKACEMNAPAQTTQKPFKIPRSTLIVIYNDAREVLLIERADHPGYWQSVTGSQDEGETLAQTAAREVGEETGIDAGAFSVRAWGHTQRRACLWTERARACCRSLESARAFAGCVAANRKSGPIVLLVVESRGDLVACCTRTLMR